MTCNMKMLFMWYLDLPGCLVLLKVLLIISDRCQCYVLRILRAHLFGLRYLRQLYWAFIWSLNNQCIQRGQVEAHLHDLGYMRQSSPRESISRRSHEDALLAARLRDSQNGRPGERVGGKHIFTFKFDCSFVNSCWHFHGAAFTIAKSTGNAGRSMFREDRSMVDKLVAGSPHGGGMVYKSVND